MSVSIDTDDPMFGSYPAPPDRFDEMLGKDGAVREHWSYLTGALAQLGPIELESRRRETARLLRDDGVTYNTYEAGQSRSSSWALDPIPLLLSSDEWAGIERGVLQRAELLNLVLADLYGERTLVRRGVIPLEIIYGHRGFLRQCDGLQLPGALQLFSYACEMARDTTGQFWAIGDFAQAPSGAGYALENRRVLSRVFPSLYRDSEVHRLAPFFRAMRAAMLEVAPAGIDDPRVVVLSPGPLNETYFEHAYLSSYLGHTLVEGADLTVRDGRVYLRALAGLEPVHVIVRRVDGWYCDPLELKPDSQLGVPGLVEAARRGHVSVVNTFGSSVLENAGLLPFLPRIAQHVLGQPLELPTATTWWCGDDRDRQHVFAHLENLVVKPIARKTGSQSIYGWRLSQTERDELRARIDARPYAFVAQERLEFSSVPCLAGSVGDRRGGLHLEARPVVLRAFAVARNGSYSALPGGLARVAASGDGQTMSAQGGGISKDTWVLASEPEKQTGFWLLQGPGVTATDPAGAMSARAAENLFWLGRYAERAESTIRLLRCILDRRTDFHGSTNSAGTECLDGLLSALTRVTATYPGFVGDGAAERLSDPEPELLAVIGDMNRGGSLAFSLRSLLASAQAVRDQLSADTWLVVSEIERELNALDLQAPDPQAAMQTVLTGLIRSLLALAGLAHESMVRDPGWRFMDAGRRLERAILLTELLRTTVVPVRSAAAESLMLESVLMATESIITYRRRYRSQAQVETVLDLLLMDDDNPRSLMLQLTRLNAELVEFPRPGGQPMSPEERLALEAFTMLRIADTAGLATPSTADASRRLALDDLLTSMSTLLGHTADAIDSTHFTHLEPRRTFVADQPDDMGRALSVVMP